MLAVEPPVVLFVSTVFVSDGSVDVLTFPQERHGKKSGKNDGTHKQRERDVSPRVPYPRQTRTLDVKHALRERRGLEPGQRADDHEEGKVDPAPVRNPPRQAPRHQCDGVLVDFGPGTCQRFPSMFPCLSLNITKDSKWAFSLSHCAPPHFEESTATAVQSDANTFVETNQCVECNRR